MVSVLDPLRVKFQFSNSATYSDHQHHYKVHPEIGQHT